MRELSIWELREYEQYLRLRQEAELTIQILSIVNSEIPQELTDIICYKGIHQKYKCDSYSRQYQKYVEEH